MKRFCFVLMPFRDEFDEILGVIRSVVKRYGLECRRADEVYRAGNVIQMILDDIEEAEIIISDLTGRNPNVFYETAIAHMKKDPHKVILLAQRDEDVPFDLQALRYLRYSNNREGREKLKHCLREFIRQGIKGPTGRLFETIEGKTERTRRIVADCEALSRSGSKIVESLTIRTEAGLSCLAISDDEVKKASAEEKEYRKLLIRERDQVIGLIKQGATFKAILTPRIDPLLKGLGVRRSRPLGKYLIGRYERLLAIIEEPDEYLSPERCQLVILPPGYTRSSLILGNRLLYEGIKAGVAGGFELTSRVTDQGQIDARVRAFDSLFKEAVSYTLEVYGNPRLKNPHGVRMAFTKGLRTCYENFLLSYRGIRSGSIEKSMVRY